MKDCVKPALDGSRHMLRLLDVTHNVICKCKVVVTTLNICLKHNNTLRNIME